MESVGAFEAKTHLAALLDRHGIPAAALVPVSETEAKLSHKDIVAGMRVLRARVKPGDMSMKDMISEGRRY